jgi:hypothetical protein
LIVIGAKGRSLAALVLLGSVTEKLIETTHVPILAVKKKGSGMGFLEALLAPGAVSFHRPERISGGDSVKVLRKGFLTGLPAGGGEILLLILSASQGFPALLY